jgi:hypothetical protein
MDLWPKRNPKSTITPLWAVRKKIHSSQTHRGGFNFQTKQVLDSCKSCSVGQVCECVHCTFEPLQLHTPIPRQFRSQLTAFACHLQIIIFLFSLHRRAANIPNNNNRFILSGVEKKTERPMESALTLGASRLLPHKPQNQPADHHQCCWPLR